MARLSQIQSNVQQKAAPPLRSFQKEALQTLNGKGHVICVAPTGSGKSRIFVDWLRTRSTKRAVLFVPLVALARQHRLTLNEAGVLEDRVQILSPESVALNETQTLKKIKKWNPSLIICDECHCVWEWGNQFRPALSRLPSWVSQLQVSRSLWLTATLNPEARRFLIKNLPQPVYELGRFELPKNLEVSSIRVPWADRLQVMLDQVHQNSGQGVVFCWTRNACERTAQLIRESGRSALAYHAGLSREERITIEDQLRKTPNLIIVATSAFGMGMDITDLKWVLLWKAPSSVAALAQAFGRVGRSGNIGRAIVMWDESDFETWEWAIQGCSQKRSELQRIYQFLIDTEPLSLRWNKYF